MALAFVNGTGNRVEFGNTGTDPTTASVYLWMYLTDTSNGGQRVFDKSAGTGFWRVQFLNDGGATNGAVRLIVDYDGNDADAVTVADTVPVNAWVFLAGTWAGTGNAPKIYTGSLTALAAEASYASTQVNTGSRVTDGGASVSLGCQTGGAPTLGITGRVAYLNWIPGAELSLAALQSHQFRPRPHASSKVFSVLGYNGTGTQPDWSGSGFNGTVTGATVADHVPLAFRPRRPVAVPYLITPSASEGSIVFNLQIG